jgi:ABC-type sulfate/molybdate transport systems ATPase subunit
MPPPTFNMDITVLPPDVLLLCDEPFYELVHKLAGPVEAKLLEVQGVRSAYSLMYTDDIFDVLKYQCKELNEIKKNACLLLDDNQFIVKPGCKSNLKYFTQLLRLKNQEHLKTVGVRTKSKRISNDDDNSNISILQSSAQVLPESSPISQDTTTTSKYMK